MEDKYITKEEFCSLVDHLCWDSNDPYKYLGELYDQLEEQFHNKCYNETT